MSSAAEPGASVEGRECVEVGRTAARGTASLMAAQAVSMASGYVVAVVLARGLGPELYGVYGIVISVLVATELIGRLGVPQVTSKLIAEGRLDPRQVERSSLTLTLGIYLAITALFVLAAPWLARAFEIEDGARLFRIAAIDIPFYGMLFATQHVLNGERRFGAESLGVSLYGVAKAGGVCALLWLGLSVENALLANAFASVVGLAWFALRLAPGAWRPSLALAAPILRLALPTALLVVASQGLANLDLWCLKWTSDASEEATVGLYVAATNLARLPSVVHFVMTAVLIPSVARLAGGEDLAAVRGVVRAAMRFLLLLLGPACAWLALRSEVLMELVYEHEYVPGAGFQAWLVVRYGLLSTLAMTSSSVLLALGRPAVAARRLLLAIPIGALVILGAIELLGPSGAAIGSLVTLGVALALLLAALAPVVGGVLEARAIGLAGVASLAVWGVTRLWVPTTGWLVADGVGCFALVALVLRALGGWNPRELLAFLRGGATR